MLKGNTVAILGPAFSSASGVLLSLQVSLPPGAGLVVDSLVDAFDTGQYIIETGSGVSAGAIGVNLLLMSPSGSPVWVAATTPNNQLGVAFSLIPTLGASTVYNGSLSTPGSTFFPCLGMQLTVSGLSGGNIIAAQLMLTRR